MERLTLLAPITTRSGKAVLTGRVTADIPGGSLVAVISGDDGRPYLVTLPDGALAEDAQPPKVKRGGSHQTAETSIREFNVTQI